MRHPLLLLIAFCLPLAAQSTQWTLAWSDEFNGSSLDATKWVYETGGNGWGNNEAETYTDRAQNVSVQNGMLQITALKETFRGSDNITKLFTSGRIKTLGKFSQTYGRFEARIKIPFGQGIWPAFWMLGDDINTAGWPQAGEIDIMENIGKEPSIVHGTVHGPGYSGGNGIGGPYSLPGNPRFADDFHVYAVEWEPTRIRWYVDDSLFFTVTSTSIPSGSKWVFDHPFHMLLNLAVGGNWPGAPDDTTTFPQTMQVDYVRVYKAGAKPTLNAAVNGASFQKELAPGSWFSVTGSQLATNTRTWRADEIIDNNLPTSLDGTQVLVNGKPAYIAYISPTQINALVPNTGTGPGTVTVVVNGVSSDAIPATIQSYAPAFFYWVGSKPAATTPDYKAVTSAKPGDVIILWGTGFGATTPAVVPGIVSPAGAVLAATPTIRLGSQTAEYIGGALAPGSAGLYQIAIRIPASAPAGDLNLTAEIGGVTMNLGVPMILTVAP